MVLGLLKNIDKVDIGDCITVCSKEHYMVFGGKVLKKWFIQSATPDEEDYYYLMLQVGDDTVSITTKEKYRIVSLMKANEQGEYFQVSNEIAAENLGLDIESLDVMDLLKKYVRENEKDLEKITEEVALIYSINGNKALEPLVEYAMDELKKKNDREKRKSQNKKIVENKRERALLRLCHR